MTIKFADCTKFLQQLVAFDTKSSDLKAEDSSNLALIEWAQKELEALGYSCIVQEVCEGKYNLWARLRPDLKTGVMLSGHSDTVPAKAEQWSTDPHTLTKKDDLLYALGACDMKGSLAAFMAAAKAFAPLKDKLIRSLDLLFTCDEESSMSGATFFSRYYAKRRLSKSELCIIGEPTSLCPVIGHKGYCAREIVITGRSAHSSNPRLGLNAVYALPCAVTLLHDMAVEFECAVDPKFSVPHTTLNIGMISGGSCINQVCSEVKISLDMRPIRPSSSEEIDEYLKKTLEPVERLGYELKITTPYPDIACFHQRARGQDAFEAYIKKLTRKACRKENYCTEASLLQSTAKHMVVLGPGSIRQAHQPDEYVPEKELKKYLRMLQRLISEHCLPLEIE